MEEVSLHQIQKSIGRRVEVVAFGTCYAGVLKRYDSKSEMIRIEDRGDYVLLEMERVQAFRVLR